MKITRVLMSTILAVRSRSASVHADRGQRTGVRLGRLRAPLIRCRAADRPRLRLYLDARLLGLRRRRLLLVDGAWVEPPTRAHFGPRLLGWATACTSGTPATGPQGRLLRRHQLRLRLLRTGFWGGYCTADASSITASTTTWASMTGRYTTTGLQDSTDGPRRGLRARHSCRIERQTCCGEPQLGINGNSIANRGAATTYNSGARGYSALQ